MKPCDQCGTGFDANSAKHRFCSRECQLDSYQGRKKEESRNRRETGFAWDPVREAKPVTVKVPPLPKNRGLIGKWKSAVILPDPQFGFHLTEDGLDPYHDEQALAIARKVLTAVRPDVTIWLGDVLDLPMFGKYRQYPSFANTFQPALDRAHEEIAITSELSGEVRFLSGNHDERLHLSVIDNLSAAAGIRPARRRTDPRDESWPALSVPNLLRLKELGVRYIGAYPAGATYLNDTIAAIHGRFIGNRRQTAAQMVVEEERVSVIYGHTHKRALAAKTRNNRGYATYSIAYSPGCLCRTDGVVPSTRGGVDPFGRPIKAFEDWQQGVGVVFYEEDGERFSIEDIPIFDGWACWRGEQLTA